MDSHSSAAAAVTEAPEGEVSVDVERRRHVEGRDGAAAASWQAVCWSMWVAAS